MRLLSAALEALVNLPIAVAQDVFTAPVRIWIEGNDSFTRGVIERIEEDLTP